MRSSAARILRELHCIGVGLQRVQRVCHVLQSADHGALILCASLVIEGLGSTLLMFQGAGIENRLRAIGDKTSSLVIWRSIWRRNFSHST